VPAAYLDVAVTKGATQWQLVRYVLFPVAQADIWDHLRGVYGVGWGWIILAEVVNAERGLGYLMDISNRRGHNQRHLCHHHCHRVDRRRVRPTVAVGRTPAVSLREPEVKWTSKLQRILPHRRNCPKWFASTRSRNRLAKVRTRRWRFRTFIRHP